MQDEEVIECFHLGYGPYRYLYKGKPITKEEKDKIERYKWNDKLTDDEHWRGTGRDYEVGRY